MSVRLEIELNHPEIGKGFVRIEAYGVPHDGFVPLALSKLGKDDDKMAELMAMILSSLSYDDEEDQDESEDESQ